ncbi:hypothetical protein VTI74DRAFT_8486 [Chaetomium olivicolor]
MSPTATRQVQTRTQRDVLKDYELHHSAGNVRVTPTISTASARNPQTTPLNPPDWDTTHRRVPPYRPTNRDRDQGEVRVYQNAIERVFIGTMFTGVFINASAAKIWRGSVGKLSENIFKYPIGGEL